MAEKVKPDRVLLGTYNKFSLHYLTGHSLEWYLRFILRPVIYLVIANIIIIALGSHPSAYLLVESVLALLVFLAELIVYGWLAVRAVTVTFNKTLPPLMRWVTATLAGGLTGLGVGVVMSLFKIFWYRAGWTFFNIVTEPSLRLIEGLLVAGIVSVFALTILRLKVKE
jgi:hypothetical protein